jgi:hypothetical protein
MRGKRNKDGNFQKPFNPFKWGDAFTEGQLALHMVSFSGYKWS